MQLAPVHLDLPLLSNLHTHMCDVPPRDRIVDRTYFFAGSRFKLHMTVAEHVIFVIKPSHCRAWLSVAALLSFRVKLANQEAWTSYAENSKHHVTNQSLDSYASHISFHNFGFAR